MSANRKTKARPRSTRSVAHKGRGSTTAGRKQNVITVQESRQRDHGTLDNMLEGCQIIGFDWRFIYVNDAAAGQGRRTKEEMLGHTLLQVHSGITDTDLFAALGRCMEERTPSRLEHPFTYADGATAWFEFGIQPVPEGLFILSIDITARKRAEEALRVSEEKFRKAFYTSPDSININRLEDGMYVTINHGFTQIMGYTEQELIGKTSISLNIWDNSDERKRLVASLQEKGVVENLEARFRAKNGDIKYGLMSAAVIEIDRVPHILSITRDITERKRVENVLQENSERLTRLVAASPTVIYALKVKDDTAMPIWMSENITRILGYPVEEAMQATWWPAHLHPEDRPRALAALAHLFADDYHHEYRFFRKDGSVIWIQDEHRLVRDQNGNPWEIVGTWTDITERRRAEDAVRESEARFRVIFEHANDAIHIENADEEIVDVNPRMCEMMGYRREQLLKMHVIDLQAPEVRHSGAVLKDELARYGDALFEELNLHRSGRRIPVEISVAHMVRPQGDLYISIVRDITERKHAEEILQQRLAELEAVHTISAALRVAQTLDEALPIMLDHTLAALDTEAGTIWLYRPERDELSITVSRGWFGELNERPMKPGEGIVGAVFASGQVHLSPEFARDPLVRASILGELPAGWGGACVPIHSAAETVGVLVVSVPLPRQLTPEQMKLLASLAEMAGAALHRMRLFEETARQLKFLQALHEIDGVISTSLDLGIILRSLIEHVITELGVDAADVRLLNPPKQMLEYAAGSGFRTRTIQDAHLWLGEDLAGPVVLERRVLQTQVPATARGTSPQASPWAFEGFVSYCGVPLIVKGQVRGVLEVFRRTPPAQPQEKGTWLGSLETFAAQAAIAVDNIQLFQDLQRSNQELTVAYDTTIQGWSRALDLRDKDTEGHTERVAAMTEQLARAMGLDAPEVVHVRRGALLHDIGKMGVPDAILLKPDRLTEEEWAIMRQHPQLAYDMLAPIAYLRMALDIPYCHHENWDGTGYPRGLEREQIPLAARLFAVVDVWDALTSDRPYRAAWSPERAIQHIRAQAGTHFDPEIVVAFIDLVDRAY